MPTSKGEEPCKLRMKAFEIRRQEKHVIAALSEVHDKTRQLMLVMKLRPRILIQVGDLGCNFQGGSAAGPRRNDVASWTRGAVYT